MTVDTAAVAAEVATVDEAIMRFLPEIAMIVGFIPGGSAVSGFEPLILKIMQTIDQAAKAVAAGHPGAAASAVLDEIQAHIDPTKAFVSPILSGLVKAANDPTPEGSTS